MESLQVEQSFSPRKQIKNNIKRKTHQNLNNANYLYQIGRLSNNISRQASSTQSYAPPPNAMHEYDMMMHGGFFLNNHHTPYHHVSNSLPPMRHQKQPLLPQTVASIPAFHSLPPYQQLRRTQSLSPPIVPRKTPTKTKPPPKKENKMANNGNKNNNNDNNNNNSVQLTATNTRKANGWKHTIGPDTGSVTKDLNRMLMADLDGFAGQVFRLAPPPSSLPLPKFHLNKPPPSPPLPLKLCCNAEAAAAMTEVVDSGATDNITKLLLLR